MMEATPDAIRREMIEELGAEIDLGRLQYVIENFFTMTGQAFHEIGFYYLANFGDSAYLDKSRTWQGVVDGPYKISFRWFALAELNQIDVRPPFLREALRELPPETRHIVYGGPVSK